ncbi:MAG: Flagellar motor switch protein FliM [Anaerolineales bacterium]|nr:Flagellar motor switch protein FliM [Anaerolineales bacterium]
MAGESTKLTQEEIDALLEAAPEGAEEPQELEEAGLSEGGERQTQAKVEMYDFRSPAKYSKGHIWTLQMVHENLAKRLTSSLAIYLRARVQVNLAALDQGTYAVFSSEMPNPGITYVISLKPLPGRIVLGLAPELGRAILDRMLGGVGLRQTEAGEMTEMELMLVRKAVDRILDELTTAWADIIDLNATVEAVVMNPLFAGVAFPTDSALLAMYDVFLEDVSGLMSIVLPFSVLDPIAQDLTAGRWSKSLRSRESEEDGRSLRKMAAHLHQVSIPLSVRLVASQLSLGEIAGLQAGEVLILGTHRESQARVLVGGREKYWGQPGTLNGRMAIRIEKAVDSGPLDLSILEKAVDAHAADNGRRPESSEASTPSAESTELGAESAQASSHGDKSVDENQDKPAEGGNGRQSAGSEAIDLQSLDAVESALLGGANGE